MRRDLKRIIASSKGCCDEIKENAGFDLTPSQFKGLLLLLAQSIRIEAHVPSESHLDRTFLAEVKIGDLFQIILKNIADLRRSQPGIATEHCNASICLDGSTVQRLDDFARTKAGISFSDLDFLVLLPHSSMDEWIKVGRGRLRVSDFIDMIMRNTMEQLLRKNNRDPRLVDFCYQKKSILHHPKFRGTPFMSLFAVGVEKPVRQVEVRFLPSKSDIAASPWSPITFSCTNFGDSLYISPLNEILEAKPKYTDRELNAYFARLHRAGAIPRLYSKLDLPPDLCAFLNQKRWILGLYDAETSTNPFKIIYRINGTAQYQLVTPHVLEFVGTALVSMTESQLISGLHRFAEHHDFDPTETANFISYVQTTLSLLKRAYPGLEDNFERSSQYIAKYQKNMNGNGIKKRRSPAVTHYLHFYIHWADALADIAALGMLGTPITRHILGSMLRVLRIPLKNIDRPL
ncbi:hypothetical protein EBR96_02685, partial [bacterium]|nr:hypothetical protein [bacterium]